MASRPAPKGILVIQTAFLGDVILMAPLLKRIKQLYPNDPIHVIVRSGLSEILLQTGLADFAYEIRKGDRSTYRKWITHFKRESQIQGQFKLILCVHESPRSQFFARQIPAQRRIAFQTWWNRPFFHDLIKKNRAKPEALRQLSILTSVDPTLSSLIHSYPDAGAPPFAPIPPWASLSVRSSTPHLSAEMSARLGSSLSGGIALFPGSVWATKQWTEEGFIEVARYWKKKGRRVLILGSPAEYSLCERIAKGSSTENWSGAFSLGSILSLLKSLDLVIGNDSGSAHLASLVDTPTLTIFGPTVLRFGYRPWQDRLRIVEHPSLSCRPCGSHGHAQCPLQHHRCMKEITPQNVIQASEELLTHTQPS